MKCQNPECEKEFPAERSTAKYCSERCKKIVQRSGKPKGKPGRPPKRPENELAAEVVKRVKAAKPAAEVRIPASTLLSRLTVKLPSTDTRGPAPAKKKPAASKGKEES